MMLRKLLGMLMGDEEWEAHYDHCDVFNWALTWDGLTPSGKPCSEDCGNHCGEKVFLSKSGKVMHT